jgi:pyroglutamyl-peptidase
MSATFLVTGFEPFAEHRSNSSWDALQMLRPTWPEAIATLRLPVDYTAAHAELRRALSELRPRAVLCTGLARGDVFRMEQRARRPAALAHEPGEAASRGRWPWDEMQSALDEAGVQGVWSEDAGQYVCESTYWSLLNCSGGSAAFAAFLHVPPESAAIPLTAIARAVGLVVGRRLSMLAGEYGLIE